MDSRNIYDSIDGRILTFRQCWTGPRDRLMSVVVFRLPPLAPGVANRCCRGSNVCFVVQIGVGAVQTADLLGRGAMNSIHSMVFTFDNLGSFIARSGEDTIHHMLFTLRLHTGAQRAVAYSPPEYSSACACAPETGHQACTIHQTGSRKCRQWHSPERPGIFSGSIVDVTSRRHIMRIAILGAGVAFVVVCQNAARAADPPAADKVTLVKLLEVPNYCEGVVFDHQGRGYISWKESITQFTLDGNHKVWANTGAPNGHKILADGTHLVCDASRHAVLHLDADGKMLDPASKECDGKPLRGPNDLSLDTPNRGFYFTDPGDSDIDRQIGTVHYVDAQGKTHLCAGGLAFPNGISIAPDGKRLLVCESQKNRVLEYPVLSPGKLGEMKVFADLPKNANGKLLDNQPDGMCLDAAGNVYVAHYGMRQVQVLDPTGKLLRSYPGGNMRTSNVAFGGPNRDQLFITGGINEDGNPGGLFRIDLGVKGQEILPAKR